MILPVNSYAVIWESSFDRGMQKASQSGKPLMADFYTDWCGWCKKLDQEVYPDTKVRKFSNQFIFVKINCERDRSTPQKYGISGYPTIIIFAPDGQIIRKISGFVRAERLARYMKEAVEKVGPPRISDTQRTSNRTADFDYPSDVVTKARQFYNLGRKMEERGRMPQAIKFYKKALRLVPGTTLARKTEKKIKWLED